MSPSTVAHAVETPPRAPSPTQGFGTRAVHAGSPHDPTTGAVIESISLSTTFAQSGAGKPVGAYEYTRSANPNRSNFEEAIANLEHGKHALAFSSGSAATATILQALAAGSHVVSVSDVYGGTHRYFTQVAATHGIEVTFSAAIEAEVAELIRPNTGTRTINDGSVIGTGGTALVWIESPSNPTLGLVDIRRVAEAAHARGARVVVDNTFLSPYLQNPLDHGADVVVHSVTKYINGHSDVLMGVAALNDDGLAGRLRFLQNALGAVPGAFDCWLAHRGLKTLHLRARQASANALAVAHALEARVDGGEHDGTGPVVAVNYPGLDSHRHRAVALCQHRDGLGGGMLSFRVRGGREAAERFCQHTRVFTLAESLGGVESLCEVPSVMTHAGIPPEDRRRAGVFDDLVRLSCGVEDPDDLVRDVIQALDKATAGSVVGAIKATLNGQ